MKEKLYTIPLNDAVNADDECALCNAQRSLERDAIDFAIGPIASYMESDVREATDKIGFCKNHMYAMYKYGNSLGNGLILKTHMQKVIKDFSKEMDSYKPSKGGMFSKQGKSNVEEYLQKLEDSCYVCNYYKNTYERYIATFFYLYENDEAFEKKVNEGKGFCLPHMKDLVGSAEKYLKKIKPDTFVRTLFEIEKKNLDRIEEDVSWFVDKFDYRFKDADWKNSKDALPRTIQKLVGGYPDDEPYKGSR